MKRNSEALWGYLFIAPPLLGFVLFALLPMVSSLYLSFTQYEVLGPPKWVGTGNYSRLFEHDPFAWRTLWNTVYYFIGIPIGMTISLLLAVALNQKLRFERFFRTVYFLPAVCSAVALGALWQFMLNRDYGLLNVTLRELGLDPPSWLGNPRYVKPALVLVGVWSNLGYNMVLFLAALQNVPRHLLEAADIDGASAWTKFWRITFPMISPTTFFIAVMAVIAGFQNFDLIMITTHGGPEYASATYMIWLYQNGFQYFRMGYACAMAWVLAAIILAFTGLQFWASRKWVHYD